MKLKLHINIGINDQMSNLEQLQDFEKKILLCKAKQVETVFDMSTNSHNLVDRRKLLNDHKMKFALSPLYDYHLNYYHKYNGAIHLNALLDVLEEQLQSGSSYILLHGAFTRSMFQALMSSKRVIKISSRGGGIISKHFCVTQLENPLYEHWDSFVKLVHKYNSVIFIGAAARPASVCDGFDYVFIDEMNAQKELLGLCKQQNIEALVEGIGHSTVTDLKKWICSAKDLFGDTRLKPLPISTDVAAGYDHISHAISAYHCMTSGIWDICCMTPAEHLGAPNISDIETGIDTLRVVAQIVQQEESEIVFAKNLLISKARALNDWTDMFRHSINPRLCKEKYEELNPVTNHKGCSMCGEMCPKILVNINEN